MEAFWLQIIQSLNIIVVFARLFYDFHSCITCLSYELVGTWRTIISLFAWLTMKMWLANEFKLIFQTQLKFLNRKRNYINRDFIIGLLSCQNWSRSLMWMVFGGEWNVLTSCLFAGFSFRPVARGNGWVYFHDASSAREAL